MRGTSLMYLIINLIFILLFLIACAPSLPGYLLVASGDEVFGVSKDSATKRADELRILGPGVTKVIVSPLKRYLIYSLESETCLRDLKSGEEKILFEENATCFSWSRSESVLSYIVDSAKLYV